MGNHNKKHHIMDSKGLVVLVIYIIFIKGKGFKTFIITFMKLFV